MQDSIPLLDTPKRVKLQSQAGTLKTALKDFERTFAATHNGQKPGRDDIKADTVISNKYRQYNKIRDVIAGKLGVDALNPPPPQPPSQQQLPRPRSRKHERTDSAISLTPHRPRDKDTPSKRRLYPGDIDPYDAPASVSPKFILQAVGPTPHRDGTILGIFDMLSTSGGSRKSLQDTPSSRKRKIDVLYHDMNGTRGKDPMDTQTPSQRRSGRQVDHSNTLAAMTPRSGPATGRRNHSRTPVSEGKKFMLEHFFATPSAVRFATMMHDEADMDSRTLYGHKTPLRDQVLGLSASKKDKSSVAADATPPYLKRSFSFKERLLSAGGDVKSSSTSHFTTNSTSTRAIGPHRFEHARFAPKPLSQIIADRESQQSQVHSVNKDDDDDDDDDDLDALREMEAGEINVLVGDGQNGGVTALVEQTTVWKKKGQKRTTRRSIMRPTNMKPAQGPRFVAAEDEQQALDDEGEEDQIDYNTSRVEDTQFVAFDYEDHEPDDDGLEYLIAEAERADRVPEQRISTSDHEPEGDGEASFHPYSDSERDHSGSDFESPVIKSKKAASAKHAKPHEPDSFLGKPPKAKVTSKSAGKKPSQQEVDSGMRKINPNAHSHLNFRSLKIRNKNSKAKGKGGRFGRGRR